MALSPPHPFEQAGGWGRLICRCGKHEAHGIHHAQRVNIRQSRRYSGTGSWIGYRLTVRVDRRIVAIEDLGLDRSLVLATRRELKEKHAP